jgi:hypothetical protein
MRRDLETLRERLKAPSRQSKLMTFASKPSILLGVGGAVLALAIAVAVWRLNTTPGRNQPVQAMPDKSAPVAGIQAVGGAIPQNCLQSVAVGNVTWCITDGSGERRDDGLVLRPAQEKAQAWVNQSAASLDCVFDLTFSKGKSDSSVGLEIWERLDPYTLKEYSLTFRGGAVRIVSKGIERKVRPVKSYVGRPIKVHLKASPEWLYAEIDGRVLIDRKNTYWQEPRLKPRLNADVGDAITLHSCSCAGR